MSENLEREVLELRKENERLRDLAARIGDEKGLRAYRTEFVRHVDTGEWTFIVCAPGLSEKNIVTQVLGLLQSAGAVRAAPEQKS